MRYYQSTTNENLVTRMNKGFVNEWHSRGQRFDPAYLHQNRVFSMKIPCFYNFLEDIIFLKLALLPIYYQCPKRLQSVGDAAETIHIHGGKTGGQFFHDPAKCTESGAAYLTDDKQESGDREVSALFCCAQTFNSCFSAACRMAETFSPASLAAAFSQDGKVTFRRTVRFSLARR